MFLILFQEDSTYEVIKLDSTMWLKDFSVIENYLYVAEIFWIFAIFTGRAENSVAWWLKMWWPVALRSQIVGVGKNQLSPLRRSKTFRFPNAISCECQYDVTLMPAMKGQLRVLFMVSFLSVVTVYSLAFLSCVFSSVWFFQQHQCTEKQASDVQLETFEVLKRICTSLDKTRNEQRRQRLFFEKFSSTLP